MNIVQFYSQIPADKHSQVVVSGDHLFYDGEQYIIQPDGELVQVTHNSDLKTKLDLIINQTKL